MMSSKMVDVFVVSFCLVVATQVITGDDKTSSYDKITRNQCLQGSYLSTAAVRYAGECTLACSKRKNCGAYRLDRSGQQCNLICIEGLCDTALLTDSICISSGGALYRKNLCTVAQLAYSTADTEETIVGNDHKVNYTCDTGYEFPDGSLSKQTTCLGLNEWLPALSSCQNMTCTVQSVGNSTNDAGGSNVIYGTSVTYTCNAGYTSNSSIQTACNGQESWTVTIEDCVLSGDLQSVSSSENLITTRGGTQGEWGKDTLSSDGKVYWMNGHVAVNALIEFPSESNFISNVNGITRTLPVSCDGCNGLVYGGRFYCNEAATKNVVVIDIASLNIVTRISFLNVGGNQAGNRNQCRYSWGGYSDFDIEADEEGLWVIWGRYADACNIGLSKINPNTNIIEQTWLVPASKTGKGNAFMKCGNLYVIAKYNSNPSYIQYIYDTATSTMTEYTSNNGIVWYNFHGYLSHAHYDKNEKVVYMWDSGRQSKVTLS